MSPMQGLIVPGGFGGRGIEGMIVTARYAREHHIPYFGICLGMQTAVIEFARNKAGLANANAREFDEAASYTIYLLKDCKIWDGFFVLGKLNEGRRSSATLTAVKQRQNGNDAQRC